MVEEEGVVYVYGRRGLHALEAASGTLLWTADAVPYHHVGTLTLGHDAVAVIADRHLGVYRRDTGTLLWSDLAAKRADGYFEWFDTPLVLGEAVCVARSMSGRVQRLLWFPGGVARAGDRGATLGVAHNCGQCNGAGGRELALLWGRRHTLRPSARRSLGHPRRRWTRALASQL